jgi:hypothetical protein
VAIIVKYKYSEKNKAEIISQNYNLSFDNNNFLGTASKAKHFHLFIAEAASMILLRI